MSPRKRKKDHDLPERVYRKNGAVYYVEALGNKNRWVRIGLEWNQEAKDRWVKLSEKKRIIRGSMADIMERYMDEVAPKKSKRSYEENKKEIQLLQKAFGNMDPKAVKPKHVYAYLDKRGQKAPSSANREKALLSHVFTLAIRWGIVDINPCKEVQKIKVPKRNRYITDEEFLAVKAVSNETVCNLMDLAYLTGQRIGDLLVIKLADLHDDGIYIEQNKRAIVKSGV